MEQQLITEEPRSISNKSSVSVELDYEFLLLIMHGAAMLLYSFLFLVDISKSVDGF